MNPQDRDAIESVFTRVQEVERQGAPRDAAAEALIQDRLKGQPGSAYYLAQTVLVQEQALKAAQQRISELEKNPAQFGTQPGTSTTGFGRAPAPERQVVPTAAGFGRNAPGAGGGFLAGALQTAMGVAGGMMLGNMLGGLFGGKEANAAEAPPESGQEPQADAEPDAGFDADGGGDFEDI